MRVFFPKMWKRKQSYTQRKKEHCLKLPEHIKKKKASTLIAKYYFSVIKIHFDPLKLSIASAAKRCIVSVILRLSSPTPPSRDGFTFSLSDSFFTRNCLARKQTRRSFSLVIISPFVFFFRHTQKKNEVLTARQRVRCLSIIVLPHSADKNKDENNQKEKLERKKNNASAIFVTKR